MSQNVNFSQNMDTIFSGLKDFVKTESVIGTPLVVEDKTLVPVVSVALGYGSATGNAKNAQPNPNSSNNDPNVGLGARVTTNAVVVIDKGSVSMLPVNGKGNMGQLIDKIPEMVTNMNPNAQQQNMAQNQQQQNQQQNQPAASPKPGK
ncbi:sporulation protein [Clostridium tetani]|uniref:GerW family sporulation protein n=1 Tax=Clostridium tetani TaxID=1513 RepID=UPI00100A3B6B|nr:spore germination protein GerW family protein [Clostridium tetani]RXI40311.1 sporulation protein [Clostridium tetani]